ncbi:MAG: DUF1015 family protein [Bacteroidia bacterium]
MAEIQPFRAWRYNKEQVPEPDKEFAPLYEVVGKKQLEALYERTNNTIHLSMPLSHPAAAKRLQTWKQDRVLIQDQAPAIFVYYQQFTLFGVSKSYIRKGFLCLLKLEEEDIVLHEGVIPQAVADRARLLGSLKMQVVPTHGLYEDENFELEPIMDRYIKEPMYSFLDQQGAINKIAPVTDVADIERIKAHLQPRKVFLADGHHRLAGSFANRKKAARDKAFSPNDPANFHFTYLSNIAADDIRILPTHRIWQPEITPDIPSLRNAFEQWFDLTDVSRSRQPLFDLVKGQTNTFGLASLGRRWLMKLKPGLDPLDLVDIDLPEAVKTLDYTVLHYLIFDQVLGLPYEEQRSSPEIAYEKDYSVALDAVNKGRAALTFITQEVSTSQFLAVCESGAKMPPKSTYFFPKVNCGMAFVEV